MEPQMEFEALTYGPDMGSKNAFSLDDLYSICPYRIQLRDSLPSKTDIGSLGRLPLDIMFMLLEQMPILSLLKFRNMCQYAQYIVDSMPKFRTIVQHARHALYTTLILKPSEIVTISDLYSILRRTKCELCGATAQHIWIPTASRVCLPCMYSIMPPFTRDELILYYEMDAKELSNLPYYTFPKATFYSIRNNREILSTPNTLIYDFPLVPARLYKNRRGDHMNKLSLLSPFGLGGLRPDDPKSVPSIFRWAIALIVAPWVVKGEVGMGKHCSTCLYTPDQDRVYTQKEFQEHLQTCRVRPYLLESMYCRISQLLALSYYIRFR